MSEFICPIIDSKNLTARGIMNLADNLQQQNKLNLIWLEATGCSGNIISMMNANNPNLYYFLKNIVNLKYNNSLMAAEGQGAYQQFLNTLETDFILVVEGAVATKAEGRYNIIASNNGLPVTAMEAVKLAGDKAKYIVAVGTCASYGGISAARPNPSGSVSLQEYLKKNILKVPGCPGHPEWIIGTIAHLVYFGMPELDEQGRPIIFYGITIHDRCSRRSYFDRGIFAEHLGEPECMFKLGCRGPITRTDCPIRKWNDHSNWPIGDNTPCIGCARQGFPDGMEPFVRY
ncbi:MAG: Ni/Fe hydrogenase [Clostridia bacterium]|jgi:hydrogenase small subunit|nr:Ni/Fe hydrogenase [Clostridia bacterium]